MLDHISLAVSDLSRSGRFYDACLAPLGIVPHADGGDFRSYARDGSDDFSIHAAALPPPSRQAHYAFKADTPAAVDAFHRAALSAGGRDDGPPGLRPEYHAGYYAAFVLDPDGHRIEAVCHQRS